MVQDLKHNDILAIMIIFNEEKYKLGNSGRYECNWHK